MHGNVAVLAQLQAHPGKGPALAAALQELVDVVSDEPGAVTYALHQVADDPDRLWFYELYRDEDAFAAHGRDPRFGEISASLADLLAEPPRIERASVVAGFAR